MQYFRMIMADFFIQSRPNLLKTSTFPTCCSGPGIKSILKKLSSLTLDDTPDDDVDASDCLATEFNDAFPPLSPEATLTSELVEDCWLKPESFDILFRTFSMKLMLVCCVRMRRRGAGGRGGGVSGLEDSLRVSLAVLASERVPMSGGVCEWWCGGGKLSLEIVRRIALCLYQRANPLFKG